MKARSFQRDHDDLCRRIVAGTVLLPEFIGNHVCPGGGKSLLPVISAHWFIGKSDVAEKLCWVVPNGSLREQALSAFARDSLGVQLYGHSLEIVASINNQNPSKGLAGYVTTYQSLLRDSSGINRAEFEKYRYILILDEAHHCALNGAWHKAVEPLVERAVLTQLMTGTIDRGDRSPIYAFPYGFDNKVNKDENDPDFRWISYPVSSATRERAIIQVSLNGREAAAKWYDKEGVIQEAEKLGANRDALMTALRTEYASALLNDCAQHWLQHRKKNTRSKLLVVCSDVEQARLMLVILRRLSIVCDIATYKDDEADQVIKTFRETDSLQALVTVYKAYEGLDVRAIDHIACLTHIRSRPWIEQMIARGWRYDPLAGEWDTQRCYIYAPYDDAFLKCIKAIEDEQQEAVRSMREVMHGSDNPPGRDDPPLPPAEIAPITSKATESWSGRLHGEIMTPEETEYFRSLAESVGLRIAPEEAKAFFDAAKRREADGWTPNPVDPVLRHPEAAERIKLLRGQLDQLVHSLAQGDGEECTRLNSQLKRIYGAREGMDEKMLRDAIAFLRRTYSNRLRGMR